MNKNEINDSDSELQRVRWKSKESKKKTRENKKQERAKSSTLSGWV